MQERQKSDLGLWLGCIRLRFHHLVSRSLNPSRTKTDYDLGFSTSYSSLLHAVQLIFTIGPQRMGEPSNFLAFLLAMCRTSVSSSTVLSLTYRYPLVVVVEAAKAMLESVRRGGTLPRYDSMYKRASLMLCSGGDNGLRKTQAMDLVEEL